MKKRITICILPLLSALILSACGGTAQMASAAGPEVLANNTGEWTQSMSTQYTNDTPISEVINDPVCGRIGG